MFGQLNMPPSWTIGELVAALAPLPRARPARARQSRYFRPHRLEKLGRYGQTSADNANGQLGKGPEAHQREVVADVPRLCEAHGVVEPEDGGDARAGNPC